MADPEVRGHLGLERPYLLAADELHPPEDTLERREQLVAAGVVLPPQVQQRNARPRLGPGQGLHHGR